jgi:cell wall-associated NlpC family hydrolase
MPGQKAYVSQKGVVGYDCSGLMVTMLKKAGIDISRYGSSRAMKVPKDQLRPGDLLVKNGHVAMYLGDGKMIESVPSGVRVTSASTYINDPAYSGHRPGELTPDRGMYQPLVHATEHQHQPWGALSGLHRGAGRERTLRDRE